MTSARLTPAAMTAIRTSPGPGSGVSTESRTSASASPGTGMVMASMAPNLRREVAQVLRGVDVTALLVTDPEREHAEPIEQGASRRSARVRGQSAPEGLDPVCREQRVGPTAVVDGDDSVGVGRLVQQGRQAQGGRGGIRLVAGEDDD